MNRFVTYCCEKRELAKGSGSGKPKSKKDAPKVIDPQGKLRAEKVDKFSRKAFPIVFLIFKVIYWIFYTVS